MPPSYKSSLDAEHHRCASDPMRAHLFTDFMVDHLLLRDGMAAADAALLFGVSDHAAISARISAAAGSGTL